MYPIIHDFKADNLTSRGYGALIDCISADVSEELNGGFTLEIKYPLHGARAEYLIPGNIIVAKPSHDQPPQAFRISQVKRSLTNSITAYANHISYDLSGYLTRTASSFSSLTDTIAYMNTLDWSSQAGDAVYHQFSFDTDMSSNAVFRSDGLQSLKAWMGGHEGSLIDIYGGEWAYDNFNCSLKERRGEDTGIRVSYGKNLAEYVKEQTNSLFSHVVAYWAKNDITVCSDFVSVGAGSPFKAVYYNATDKYESQPTVAQLNAIAATIKPSEDQTITVTPAQIGDIIGLGDSVYICYEGIFTTRVVKATWDVLTDQYKKWELGTKKANITETIKSISSSGDGMKVKSKSYSGTLNTYGCIQTDLKPDAIVLDAKTVSGTSFQCTPLIAGGWWWVRAVDWATGNKGSGNISVTVDYI